MAEDRPGKPKLSQHTGGGFTNSPILARIHSWNTHVRSYWNAESFNKGKLWPSWISHTKFWRKSLQICNFSRCEISQFERWQLSYLFFRGQIIKRFEDILNLLKKNSQEIKKYCMTRLTISSCEAAGSQWTSNLPCHTEQSVQVKISVNSCITASMMATDLEKQRLYWTDQDPKTHQ